MIKKFTKNFNDSVGVMQNSTIFIFTSCIIDSFDIQLLC